MKTPLHWYPKGERGYQKLQVRSVPRVVGHQKNLVRGGVVNDPPRDGEPPWRR